MWSSTKNLVLSSQVSSRTNENIHLWVRIRLSTRTAYYLMIKTLGALNKEHNHSDFYCGSYKSSRATSNEICYHFYKTDLKLRDWMFFSLQRLFLGSCLPLKKVLIFPFYPIIWTPFTSWLTTSTDHGSPGKFL